MERLGVDEVRSLERLARVVSELGDPDIICFQEVSQYMPDMDGGLGINQITGLEGLFQPYESVFGPAVERGINPQIPAKLRQTRFRQKKQCSSELTLTR